MHSSAQARGSASSMLPRQASAAARQRIGRNRLPPAKRLRSEEHTSELQSHHDLVCRLLLEKKKWENGSLESSVDERVPASLGGWWSGVHPATGKDIKDPSGSGRVKVSSPWTTDSAGAGVYQ